MKILVVMGSPRKRGTRTGLPNGSGTPGGARPRRVRGPLWLRDANLLPCRGCAVCVARGEEHCPNRDDAQAIVRKMREADGAILASPAHRWSVTGQFKVFIDRLNDIMHRPRFHEKKALILTTAMFTTKEVEDYLAKVAQFWGFEVAARAGLITPPTVPARQLEE